MFRLAPSASLLGTSPRFFRVFSVFLQPVLHFTQHENKKNIKKSKKNRVFHAVF